MSNTKEYFSHIVLALNDGIKRNQVLNEAGFTIVTSHEELRQLDWSDKNRLLIQTELNWFHNPQRQNTLYDGYFVLLEICENHIPFNGSIGMISCASENEIYNASNNQIYPLIDRIPYEFVHICDDRKEWDKKLLMQHFHEPYSTLKTECRKGFIQLNTGASAKIFEVKHQKGTAQVIARKNKSGEYIIRKSGFAGWFGQIGKSNTEHGIIEELLKHFFPVHQLSSQILVQKS